MSLKIALWFLLFVSAIAQTPEGPPNGRIPASFFGLSLVNVTTASQYPTVSIGSMGKQSNAEWEHVEPFAPGEWSKCNGTRIGSHCYLFSAGNSVTSGTTTVNAVSPLDVQVSMATIDHEGLFMYTFTGAPSWAVCGQGSNPACTYGTSQCAPTGWANITSCKGQITRTADMQSFITIVTSRYNGNQGHGLISAFEVNNENYYLPDSLDCNSSSRAGPMAIFAKTVDLEVKAAVAGNPNIQIAGPGFTAVDTCFASGKEFDAFWKAWGEVSGNSRARLDAISFHDYPAGNSGSSTVPLAEDVIRGRNLGAGSCANTGFVPCVKAAIKRLGIIRPGGGPPELWDTESSWGMNSQLPNPVDQVAFVGKMELLSWAAGVSRQAWYSWNNSGWGTMCCPPNANAAAYQQVHNWMVGSMMTNPCAIEVGTIWGCQLMLADGRAAKAVWNTGGNIRYSVRNVWRDYRALDGTITKVTDTFTVPIGMQPILLESATPSGVSSSLTPSADLPKP